MINRTHIFARWLSQGLNTLNAVLFWDSKDFQNLPRPEDVTFSSYIGYKVSTTNSSAFRRWEKFVNWLFRDPAHCANSFKAERDSFAIQD